jgi:hypothetical protein
MLPVAVDYTVRGSSCHEIGGGFKCSIHLFVDPRIGFGHGQKRLQNCLGPAAKCKLDTTKDVPDLAC